MSDRLRGARIGFILVSALVACASEPQIVDHSFAFDAYSDSPGVTILDYRYGSSNAPGASNLEARRKEGRSPQRTSTTGPMTRGADLYVKWRVDATSQIFERTVDLRGKLPRDIDGETVYFIVDGSQLSVFLISRRPRDPGSRPIGPKAYQHRKVVRIFPNP